MKPMLRISIACLAAVAAVLSAGAQEPAGRKELKRVDVSGAPAMELVTSITEYRPGDELERHLHHGLEALYVVQGAMIQLPGKEPQLLATGTSLVNLRDVPHGGFRIVGDRSLILFTTHVVDKGKALYDKAPPAP
jgi:quercetin dioxygenase-like cupin family protein